MVNLERRHADAGARAARWAWIAVAVVPVGLALGLVLALAGIRLGDSGALILAAALVWIAAPTAAVVLAVRAARAGQPTGRLVMVAAGLLFAAIPALTVALLGPLVALVGLAATLVAGGVVALRLRSDRQHRS